MNKKILSIVLIICFFITPVSYVSAKGNNHPHASEIPGNEKFASSTDYVPSDGPSVSARAAIVMDIDTGLVLYEKNADNKMYPASTTKLMTALLALSNYNMNDELTVSSTALENIPTDATTMGLIAGEKITVRDLLSGLLLVSANEAANVLAEGISGNISSFASLMNQKATEIGCTSTHFANANGLHDNEHYTTAYDMALIARTVYQYSDFRNIVKSTYIQTNKTNMSSERDLWTSNQLLYDVNDFYCSYCTGGKTGYTEEAGECLVSYAEKNGMRLVTILFNCDNDERFYESKEIYEFIFNNYSYIKPLNDTILDNINTCTDASYLLNNYNTLLTHEMPRYSLDTNVGFTVRNTVSESDFTITPVINRNVLTGIAGYISVMYNNKEISRTDLYISARLDNISKAELKGSAKKTQVFLEVLKEHMINIILAGIIVVLLIIILILYKLFLKIRRPNVHHYSGKRKNNNIEKKSFNTKKSDNKKEIKSQSSDGNKDKMLKSRSIGDDNKDKSLKSQSISDTIDNLLNSQRSDVNKDKTLNSQSTSDTIDNLLNSQRSNKTLNSQNSDHIIEGKER